MKKIICPVDYVVGHLRDGHYELVLSEEEYAKFQESSDEEKEGWIRDGELVVDDYEVDDTGCLEMNSLEVYTPSL